MTTPTAQPTPGSFDTDGDGYVDLVRIDEDGDGSTDFLQSDVDYDGLTDVEAIDLDGDGDLETFALDDEGDGEFETLGTDLDGDGAVDVVASPAFTGILDNSPGGVDLGLLGDPSSVPVLFGSMADDPYGVLDLVESELAYTPSTDSSFPSTDDAFSPSTDAAPFGS